MSDYYDRHGKPLDDEGMWLRLFEDREYSCIALDTIDGVDVSTIWIGVNYRHGEGAPLIFETLIIGGDHDQEQERYSTEAAARAGHRQWVTLLEDEARLARAAKNN